MAKPSRPSNAIRGAPRSKSGGGFLLGMFVGLIVGLAVALGIAFYLNKTPIPFMTKKATGDKPADAGKPPEIAGMPSSKAPPAAEKPKFDFYKILPGSEEPVSDKELKAAAKGNGKSRTLFPQAALSRTPDDADNARSSWQIGFEARSADQVPDKGTWYRVRMGPLPKSTRSTDASTMATNGMKSAGKSQGSDS